MKVVLYTRALTGMDARGQTKQMQAYALSAGWQIAGKFKDKPESTLSQDAPALWDAIKSLKTGQTLLVQSYHALSRNVAYIALIERVIHGKGASLHSVTEKQKMADTPIGCFVREILRLIDDIQQRMGTEAASARKHRKE